MSDSIRRAFLTVALLTAVISAAAFPDSLWATDMASYCVRAYRYPASGGASDRAVDIVRGGGCPVGLAAGQGRLWVPGSFGCNSIANTDPVTGEVSAVLRLNVDSCPSAIAYGDGFLWVGYKGPCILKVDPSTGEILRTIDLTIDVAVAHVAYGGGYLWVVDLGLCTRIRKIDPSSGVVVHSWSLGTSDCIRALTYGDGYLWAAGPTGSRKISKIDPADGGIVDTIDLGYGYPIKSLAYEDDAQPAPDPITVSAARATSPGTPVLVESAIATARFADHAYVEAADRSAGIRVTGDELPSPGTEVDLLGTIELSAGEKSIHVSDLTVVGAGTVDPLGIPVRNIALYGPNSGAMHALSTTGLCSAGLLVRTWGRVTETGAGHFYVDDGSGIKDGTGATGLRILCDGLTPPAWNKHVRVTGISTLFPHADTWLPCVRLRDSSDLVVLD